MNRTIAGFQELPGILSTDSSVTLAGDGPPSGIPGAGEVSAAELSADGCEAVQEVPQEHQAMPEGG